jgi:hypothetical protein
MFVVPFAINEKQYSLMVVLQEDNIERIRSNDPAEVAMSKLSERWQSMKLADVIVTYATSEDEQTALKLFAEGKGHEALRFLTRGYAYRPEAGDHDGPALDVFGDKGPTQ